MKLLSDIARFLFRVMTVIFAVMALVGLAAREWPYFFIYLGLFMLCAWLWDKDKGSKP